MPMKNNQKFKNTIIIIFCIFILTLTITISFNIYKYRSYTKNYNMQINSIINVLKEKYPSITDEEIASIINSTNNDTSYLASYGIDIEKDSVIIANDYNLKKYLLIDTTIIFSCFFILLIVILLYGHYQSRDINTIIKYLEALNHYQYDLEVDDNSEDELSILKNELYKITVMLKEAAENSYQDKLNLKKSLSDISHQLKTPLTSIVIMLDNIIDNENMDPKTRQFFLKEIKRETTNISFLITSLLKLSKLDANAIKYNNSKEKLKNLINESVKKVSALCDLKNITININGNAKDTITCDIKWQTEAISNIIKNCVESSPNNSKINISYANKSIYSEIIIKDTGPGISKNDLPYIFERFYKGKNSKKDSIGIGLALAKSIIEQSNGKITVQSEPHKGTEFTIKYYQ